MFPAVFLKTFRCSLVYCRKIYWTDWGWEPKIEGATMDGGNRSIIMRLLNGSWPNALTWDSEGNVLQLYYWSLNVIKRTFGHIYPANIQISLRLRAVWSESSLCAVCIDKDTKCLHANKEDRTVETARLRRLIRVLAEKISDLTLQLSYSIKTA